MADRRQGTKYRSKRKARSTEQTLDDLFALFFDAKIAEGVSKRTLETYEESYRYLCEYMKLVNTTIELKNITSELLRAYITWMMKVKRKWEGHPHKSEGEMTEGLSLVTVNSRLKGVRTMFNFLEAEDAIKTNPFRRVKTLKVPEEEIEIMTEEQLERLLKAPNKRTYAGFRDYVFMMTLLDGFFRINEALGLKKNDINFELGLVKLPATKVKTRKARSVPLEKNTLRLIKELIKENESFSSDYIFLTNYGEPINDDRMRDRIKGHAEAAGIEVRVFPHLFRHTAATLFLANGGDIRHLAEILGHRDLRMTMKYTHLSHAVVKEQHDKYTPSKKVIPGLNRQRKSKRDLT